MNHILTDFNAAVHVASRSSSKTENMISYSAISKTQKKNNDFVKGVKQPPPRKIIHAKESYFNGAKDSKLQVDLDKLVKTPVLVLQTRLRPAR